MALTKQLKPRHEGQRPFATLQGSFSSAARDQKTFEDCVHFLIDGRGAQRIHICYDKAKFLVGRAQSSQTRQGTPGGYPIGLAAQTPFCRDCRDG